MLDPDTIAQQLTLLATHRRTLAHLLQQAAQYGGEVFAPPQTANGIAEARAEIQRIKAILRESGFQVEDEPNDEAPLQGVLRQSSHARDNRASTTAEISQERTRPQLRWRPWGDFPLVITIGTIAALIAIISFVTGAGNLSQLISALWFRTATAVPNTGVP